MCWLPQAVDIELQRKKKVMGNGRNNDSGKGGSQTK